MTHPHQITDPAAVKDFIFAGNAVFTLKSKGSGAHYTYKVQAAKDRNNFWFAKVAVSGNDDWRYIGFIKDWYHPRVIKGAKGLGDEAPSVAGLNWLLRQAVAGDTSQLDQAEFWHEGRCCACGRLLTDPASIERGIGPECMKKAAA
jgi:GNAT superfamily N-acetyltransferase